MFFQQPFLTCDQNLIRRLLATTARTLNEPGQARLCLIDGKGIDQVLAAEMSREKDGLGGGEDRSAKSQKQ
jgi:hypothetical protein